MLNSLFPCFENVNEMHYRRIDMQRLSASSQARADHVWFYAAGTSLLPLFSSQEFHKAAKSQGAGAVDVASSSFPKLFSTTNLPDFSTKVDPSFKDPGFCGRRPRKHGNMIWPEYILLLKFIFLFGHGKHDVHDLPDMKSLGGLENSLGRWTDWPSHNWNGR